MKMYYGETLNYENMTDYDIYEKDYFAILYNETDFMLPVKKRTKIVNDMICNKINEIRCSRKKALEILCKERHTKKI